MRARLLALSLAFSSAALAAGWHDANGGLWGGTVFSVAGHPTDGARAWAATPEGIYRTTDGGATWRLTALPPSSVERAVFVDPTEPTVVFSTADGGGWRSTDGGATFAITAGGASFTFDLRAPGRVWSPGRGQLLRSDDHGATWTGLAVPANSFFARVDVDPNDSSTLWASGDGGAYVSHDAGASWTQVYTLTAFMAAVQPGNSRQVFIATEFEGLRRSDDGGATFTAGFTQDHPCCQVIFFGPGGPDQIFASAGADYGFYESTDDGASWTPILGGNDPNHRVPGVPPVSVPGFAFGPGQVMWAAGAMYPPGITSGIWRSADGGASWSYGAAGIRETTPSVIAVDPINTNYVYVASDSNHRLMRSVDGASSWVASGYPSGEDLVTSIVVDPSNPAIVYAIGDSGLWRSTDRARSFTRRSTQGFGVLQAEGGGSTVLWRLLSFGTLSRSTDAGATFTEVQGNLLPYNFAVSGKHRGVVYMEAVPSGGGFIGLYRSLDDGKTFSKRADSGGAYPGHMVGLVIDPTSANLVLGCGAQGAYRSTDGGLSWKKTSSAACLSLAQQQASPYRAYFGATNDAHTVYASDDHGGTWTAADAGLPGAFLLAVFPGSSAVVYAGTHQRGVFATTTGGR